MTLTEVMHIAAEAGVDLRTAKRVLGDRHRPSVPVRSCIVRALIVREHVKLARALERDGRLHESQRDPSWERGPGRPGGVKDTKQRKPYTKRKKVHPWK